MKMKRCLSPILFPLTIVMLFGVGNSAFAQNYQTATLTANSDQIAQGETVDVTLSYNVTDGDNTLSGIGVFVCYDSSVIEFESAVWGSAEANAFRKSPDPPRAVADPQDFGEFGATGKVIGLIYMDTDGKFPNAVLPVDLVTLTFRAQSTDAATSVKVVPAVDPAPGYEFQGTDAAVTVGTAVQTYTVTFNISGNGYLNTDGNDQPVVHTVNEGADAPTVTAIPMADNEFVNWTDADGAEYATTEAITVTNVQANATYTANFKASTSCQAVILSKPPTIEQGKSYDWTAETVDVATGYKWDFYSVDASGNEKFEKAAFGNPAANVSFSTLEGQMKVILTVTCGEMPYPTAEHSFTITTEPPPDCTDEVQTVTCSGNNGNRTVVCTYNGDVAGMPDISYDFGDSTGLHDAAPGEKTTTYEYAKADTYKIVVFGYVAGTEDECGSQVFNAVVVTDSTDPCAAYTPGDYDMDHEIDIFDALAVAMYVVEMEPVKSTIDGDACLKAALDVDGVDAGAPTIEDALAIARHDVGLPCTCILDSYLK